MKKAFYHALGWSDMVKGVFSRAHVDLNSPRHVSCTRVSSARSWLPAAKGGGSEWIPTLKSISFDAGLPRAHSSAYIYCT